MRHACERAHASRSHVQIVASSNKRGTMTCNINKCMLLSCVQGGSGDDEINGGDGNDSYFYVSTW